MNCNILTAQRYINTYIARTF